MKPLPLSCLSRCCFWLTITAITILAVWPNDRLNVGTGWDKSNHLLAFFVLFFLFDYGWEKSVSLFLKVGVLLGYGLSLELLQAMVPMREMSLLDVFSDVLGMTIYLLLRAPLLSLRDYLERMPFIKPG